MALRGLILAVLFVTGLAGVEPVQAQQTASDVPQVVLTIDPDRLFADSLYGERVVAEISADTEALQKEFLRLETDLTAEEKDITEKRASMAPADIRAMPDA